MRKSADVAILMQPDFNQIELLFPSRIDDWKQWEKQSRPDIPFSDVVIAFLNALSGSLLKDKLSREYPDVVTFAFFCRKANLLALKDLYSEEQLRLGRGILFHIAPSNVPVNFGYSLVAGLLSGNHNIVRVSSKNFVQVEMIIRHINELSQKEEFKEISERIVVLRYDRENNVATQFFSAICNVRVIWGGDESITRIRKSLLPARSFDVTFSDRYSLSVINADQFVNEANVLKIAEGFYNDTYLFDQNACSAPHLMVWTGSKENVKKSREKFWGMLYKEVHKKYEFQPVMAIDKLTAFYTQSVHMPVTKENTPDNSLVRVELKELLPGIENFRSAGGYFSEYTASSLDDILPIINNKYQTLAYYGMDKDILSNFVLDHRIKGIDRIVPIGSTTNFSLTWDGYNLIKTFTRECDIL